MEACFEIYISLLLSDDTPDMSDSPEVTHKGIYLGSNGIISDLLNLWYSYSPLADAVASFLAEGTSNNGYNKEAWEVVRARMK